MRYAVVLVFALVLFVVGGVALAEDTTHVDKWFGKGAVGLTATTDQAQDFEAAESFSLEVVYRVFGAANLWTAYRYTDINNVLGDPDRQLNDHAIKTMLFGRPPGGDKIAPYIFFAGAATQAPKDTTRKVRASADGGVGAVIPLWDMNWGVELGAKRYTNHWLASLQVSLWVALDGRKE